jgi:hypothetical protein
MKKLIVMILMLAVGVSAHAQTGLKINSLFEGRIIPQERLVDTRVRGKTLEKYHLSYYRSLRFTVSEEERLRLRKIVDSDSRGHFADIYETNNTYTQKIQVDAQNGKNRFLCYQEQHKGKGGLCQVTVIYMEGTVSSLKQLEELLK